MAPNAWICGQPIWAAGSAITGTYMCFTCTTGEADGSGDYEIYKKSITILFPPGHAREGFFMECGRIIYKGGGTPALKKLPNVNIPSPLLPGYSITQNARLFQ